VKLATLLGRDAEQKKNELEDFDAVEVECAWGFLKELVGVLLSLSVTQTPGSKHP
jgi:hypothetical protein